MTIITGIHVAEILTCTFTMMQVQITSSCTGSGFPSTWRTSASGVAYWFVAEDIKRRFKAGYSMTDYYTSTENEYGPNPTCESVYYDLSTEYYYFLMFYTGSNIYSTTTNIQICHAFKEFDSTIREYYEVLLSTDVLTDATECISRFNSSKQSIALTKYNLQYTGCPFTLGEYNFTFSESGDADYCASSNSSTAYIDHQTISLKSCYSSPASKENPFYGEFSCLGHWTAESRDTPSLGDFVVIEMFDTVQWPYCGRYAVSPDGVITLSLYLSFALDSFFPVFCEASKDYNYYSEANGYTRMIFTPLFPVTTVAADTTGDMETTTVEQSVLSSSDTDNIWDNIRNLYWPWWILVGGSVVLVTMLICCIFYACKKHRQRQTKVEILKPVHKLNTRTQSNLGILGSTEAQLTKIQEINKWMNMIRKDPSLVPFYKRDTYINHNTEALWNHKLIRSSIPE